MTALMGSRQIDSFNGKCIVKGFAGVLYPTKATPNLLNWHLVFNEDGSGVSYLDERIQSECSIRDVDFVSVRHIVGWCSEAKYNAGAAEATYDIDPSELTKTPKGCLLEKFTLSGGMYVTAGLTFAIGRKEKPIFRDRGADDYVRRVQSVSRKFFVLWDVKMKRGWLVNGASGLLHLLRTSLNRDSNDRLSSIFENIKLGEAYRKHHHKSAEEVLISSENRGLRLYQDQGTCVHVEDRIVELCTLLGQASDIQVQAYQEDGFRTPLSASRDGTSLMLQIGKTIYTPVMQSFRGTGEGKTGLT
ncbi:hypothetical protein LTS07_003440 [Exophiala sideris]|uniref:HNH nuclease domain-containing protein n=1 Tax=Exophiala sideris TaxID=1016849 RepID=A0ABR0JIU7_9EURO|nr:hypothetical protein LTS07_003440 [Exophiala sideris]KAK5042815.1 hypothetical protein LTR13_001663 [Exophiala sideris]KAK5065898.1 hypothetical protein LTR69_003448 [Exophiala sideris]